MTRVVRAVGVAEIGEPDYDESDLRAEWNDPHFDISRKTILALDPSGEVVAYAWWYDRKEHVDYDADVIVAPRDDWATLFGELLRRIEAAVAEDAKSAPAGERVTLYLPAYKQVEAKHTLLRRADYTLRRYYFRMEMNVEAPPVVPEPPEGVTVRTCVRDQDEPAFYELLTHAFSTHFRHSPMEKNAWIRRHAGDNAFYRPELWMLAEENGQPIAAVVNMLYPDIGFVDELGVHEAHRGRGLGKLLLLKSFEAFRAAGQPRVSLAVDAGNETGATQLYENVGMKQVQRIDLYEKIMREPA